MLRTKHHFTSILIAVPLLVIMTTSGSQAQGNIHKAGVINGIFVSGLTNYGFRVTVKSGSLTALDGCQGDFAYVNGDQDNYSVMTETLRDLYDRGRTVELYLRKNDQGYCQIIELGS